jgi:chemotaxis protein MotB
VMLFAFALVDQNKFIDWKLGVAQALGKPNPTIEGGVGLLERGNGIAELVVAPPVITRNGDGSNGQQLTSGTRSALNDVSEIRTAEQAEALEEELRLRLAEVDADEYVRVERDGRGVVLTFDERVLFPSGSARINVDGQIVLGTVGQVLGRFDNQITVEGHTDDRPISNTRYPTNWDLGAGRAVSVARVFAELVGINPVQLQAVSYGEFRPRAANTTEEGRRQNRRVEVVVLIDDVPAPPDVTTGLFGINARPG